MRKRSTQNVCYFSCNSITMSYSHNNFAATLMSTEHERGKNLSFPASMSKKNKRIWRKACSACFEYEILTSTKKTWFLAMTQVWLKSFTTRVRVDVEKRGNWTCAYHEVFVVNVIMNINRNEHEYKKGGWTKTVFWFQTQKKGVSGKTWMNLLLSIR